MQKNNCHRTRLLLEPTSKRAPMASKILLLPKQAPLKNVQLLDTMHGIYSMKTWRKHFNIASVQINEVNV